jgi:ADP-ribose pyrophosphatase YjhB (NUDIX family)
MNAAKPSDHVAAARAAGASLVRVAAIIEQDGRVLLLARGGDGFIDETWQPPTVLALPDETHHDALRRGLPASTGFAMTTATEYLGHHDHALSSIELVRVLYFRVAVADHGADCRRSTVRHMWSRVDQLPANTEPSPRRLADLLASPTPATGAEPPSAEPLRAHARGLYAAQAAVELLVNHATWLRRGAFTSRFLHSAPGYPAMAYITWADAITALNSGQLPCSGGEGRILRLAASIADGIPVDLRDALTGLDQRNIDLLVQAVLHANGRRP